MSKIGDEPSTLFSIGIHGSVPDKEGIMLRHIKYRNKSKVWHDHYGPLAPKAGDIAPDFELKDVNGEKQVRLSDFRGRKPVALIFGSFT